MVTVKDVPADKLIAKLKEELKQVKEIQPLEWSYFVKSGVHKERPPQQEDFWYLRSASVLRRIYLDGPVGTERLRSYFGGRKGRGHKPARFRKASGAIIRKILQQLEASGLIEKNQNKEGRKISNKGRKFLDRIAYEVSKEVSK
jgi:small subunit ribosomal protein S19e